MKLNKPGPVLNIYIILYLICKIEKQFKKEDAKRTPSYFLGPTFIGILI